MASKWSQAENRRREGLRAAHTQDADTLIDLMTTYVRLKSSRKGRVSPLTLTHYAESVRRFLEYAGPAESPRLALNQLSGDDLEVWLLHLQEQGLSPASVKRHLYGLRNLFKALVWAGVYKTDPSADVRPPQDATPAHAKKGALPLELYRRLLELPQELHGDGPQMLRDRLMLMLGGTAGLRAAEIVGLDAADLDLRLRRLRVRGKGAKTRVVPLTGTLLEALQAWLRAREVMRLEGRLHTEALLVSLSNKNAGGRLTIRGARNIVNPYLDRAGVPQDWFGLHTLRRTAGTHLYRATRDLHVVADVLGHSNVNTSAIYAKMDADVRLEALEAVERLRQKDDK
nr:tyrosine-type recombinase/integrase [Deinobacterium chartae]